MKNKTILFLLIALFISINILFFLELKPIHSQKKINSNINREVYISLYVGDIDGDVSEDWFYFYQLITDFYETNKIPVVFSFYPESIKDDTKFNDQFLRMYEIPNIELMQKGYSGNGLELQMDKLPIKEQKEIIKNGQVYYIQKIKELEKTDDVKIPVLYNQIGSRFTEDTKKALESLGFKFYFDVYIGAGLLPVNSSKTFDVTQYGVSFTKTGNAGREEVWKTPNEIFDEINTFSREDLNILEINKKQFIPLWVHQQDFESLVKDDEIDKKKWDTYVQVVNALNNDPNVHLIHPMDAYRMRH